MAVLIRAALALALGACTGGADGPRLRPGCAPLPSQWEQVTYRLDSGATVETPSGLAVDLSHLDAVADRVDACVAVIDRTALSPAAACPTHGAPWHIERRCTTVLLVPGEPSCTVPDLWLLPDSAGGSCDTWGKPASPCKCRWAVATQDGGRTLVVPVDPVTGAWSDARVAEGFLRLATACLYPWNDVQTARCSSI